PIRGSTDGVMQQQPETTGESVPTLFQLPDCSPEGKRLSNGQNYRETTEKTAHEFAGRTENQLPISESRPEDAEALAQIASPAKPARGPQSSDVSVRGETTHLAVSATDSGTPETSVRDEPRSSFLHEPHLGPPANHVGRPPNSQGSPRSSGPVPHLPQAALPAAQVYNADVSSTQPTTLPSNEERVVPFPNEQSPTWSESPRTTWATRATIGVGMIVVLTIGYVSGRGLNSSTSVAESPEERTSMASDEIVVSLSPQEADSTPKMALTTTDSTPETSVAMRTQHDPSVEDDQSTDALDQQTAGPALSDGIGVPESTEASGGSLGSPTTATSELPTLDTAVPAYPPLELDPEHDRPAVSDASPYTPSVQSASVPSSSMENVDSTVAFRSPNESTPQQQAESASVSADSASEIEPEAMLDGLPSGMADRLKLEDGLRYTSTPYPIGNFLEILEAWEASSGF
ncbi:MAG: hypothetical protein AAGJ83_12765, partial [Planctomycetota bacterium]